MAGHLIHLADVINSCKFHRAGSPDGLPSLTWTPRAPWAHWAPSAHRAPWAHLGDFPGSLALAAWQPGWAELGAGRAESSPPSLPPLLAFSLHVYIGLTFFDPSRIECLPFGPLHGAFCAMLEVTFSYRKRYEKRGHISVGHRDELCCGVIKLG